MHSQDFSQNISFIYFYLLHQLRITVVPQTAILLNNMKLRFSKRFEIPFGTFFFEV